MSDNERAGKEKFQWNEEDTGRPERAIVLVPDLGSTQSKTAETSAIAKRSTQSRLEEAKGLGLAISLDIVEAGIIPIKTIRPATLFGRGKTDEIAGIVKAQEIGLAIVDHPLTPVQQRNLETAWNCKVLDRTGLILEIFGERARTKEGRLQVELAHLNYQRGRLVRQWTHLERQRGGLGKTGGPGETQIEADRRQLQERITRLERDLRQVTRTRELHRSKRKKIPTPVVALVGYTNAGKSTLFNRLTDSAVMAKDQLFATLDPTLRKLELPLGTRVILSDTVGFVSDLPTTLVAAFRATLEEVVEADLILHVRDIADPDTAAQSEDVYAVLDQIGIGQDKHEHILEVWNKIDLLDRETVESIKATRSGDGAPIPVSAITGEGMESLLEAIEDRIGGSDRLMNIHLGIEDLRHLSWVYDHAHVIERLDDSDGSVRMRVRVQPGSKQAFRRFAA